MIKKIAIAADHAGFELKEKVKNHLASKGLEVKDYGTHSNESCDYPDFAHALAEGVSKKQQELGVLICGSGNGVCITANKHEDIRAAMAWLPELGSLARQHNNANVVCLPSRFIEEKTAIEIVDAFLNAEFEGGRHQKRVDKIRKG
jgi:ribose 5-phosphate isomerase B